MEEYLKKQQYFQHLKKMAEIKCGNGRQKILDDTQPNQLNNSKLKSYGSKQNGKNKTRHSKKDSRCKYNLKVNTERIMREFVVGKQNYRLAKRIWQMNSSIQMSKYASEYDNLKRTVCYKEDQKKISQFVCLKIVDIAFNSGPLALDDPFKIYSLKKNKKSLIFTESLFDLRKIEIKLERRRRVLLKIEGKGQEGIIEIEDKNLIDLRRGQEVVGQVVIEFCKK